MDGEKVREDERAAVKQDLGTIHTNQQLRAGAGDERRSLRLSQHLHRQRSALVVPTCSICGLDGGHLHPRWRWTRRAALVVSTCSFCGLDGGNLRPPRRWTQRAELVVSTFSCGLDGGHLRPRRRMDAEGGSCTCSFCGLDGGIFALVGAGRRDRLLLYRLALSAGSTAGIRCPRRRWTRRAAWLVSTCSFCGLDGGHLRLHRRWTRRAALVVSTCSFCEPDGGHLRHRRRWTGRAV